jgi:NitT/TauT family transport system substrate-binding protein
MNGIRKGGVRGASRTPGTAAFVLCLLLGSFSIGGEEARLSLGFFPNVTHAHALVAQNMAADGEGWFEQRLPGVTITWTAFNAGPSAMEAVFADAIDMTYVGPSPALNAFVRAKGGVRVLRGAVRGGSGLVVRDGETMQTALDFKGKRIATPQLGNTQDIACRQWLAAAGLKVTPAGGDVRILPVANADMLPLLVRGDFDAAWTVEPWLSGLELEGNARLLHLDPPERAVTTILVSGEVFRERHPDLAAAVAAAHDELTAWMLAHPEEAKRRVVAELGRRTKRPFPPEMVERAWPRLVFDNAIAEADFRFFLDAARAAGFLKGEPSLDGLVTTP